jgi:hypothetical protein
MSATIDELLQVLEDARTDEAMFGLAADRLEDEGDMVLAAAVRALPTRPGGLYPVRMRMPGGNVAVYGVLRPAGVCGPAARAAYSAVAGDESRLPLAGFGDARYDAKAFTTFGMAALAIAAALAKKGAA